MTRNAPLIVIFFIWTIFSGLTVAFSQTDTTNINKIHKTVAKINKDTSYTIKTISGDEFLKTDQYPDNGGEIKGYFKDGQLVKIIEWIGLSSCVNITEFYLLDIKLIFSYTQGKVWQYVDSLGTFNPAIQTLTMECRYYYDKEKMIKSILKGSTHCSGEPTDEWAKWNLEECNRYIQLLVKK